MTSNLRQQQKVGYPTSQLRYAHAATRDPLHCRRRELGRKGVSVKGFTFSERTFMKPTSHPWRWRIGPVLLFGLGTLALATPPAVWAAPPVSALQAETAVAPEEIHAIIKELEAKKDIDEGLRNKPIELRRQALRYIESAGSHEAAAAFAQARASAPAETEALRQKLEQATPAPVTAESLRITEKTPSPHARRSVNRETSLQSPKKIPRPA